MESYQSLQDCLKKAEAKMEATGVRYDLSAQGRLRTLRLAEDGQDAREVTLAAGASLQGIVGRLTIEADGLRFSAEGKEDIAGLKEAIQHAKEETSALLQKFQAESETAFRKSAKEREQLQRELEQKRTELRNHLGAATLDGFKVDLERTLAARVENNMTLNDRESCAVKLQASATEINAACAQKRGEIGMARQGIAGLEEKRPNDAQKSLHQKTLEAIRTKARESATAFTDVDELHREPTRELLAVIRASLEGERQKQTKAAGALGDAETKVADLQGQLKQAQPHRSPEAILADLEEAKELCNREETLQEARALLSQRITEKMDALAAHVPVELGKKVTQHLERLTGGAAGQVVLSQQLAVAHVGGNGVGSNGAVTPWYPRQLSYGESHQAALAVKIAVACALAETSGPVFIILDDSLVTFDPRRRAATEDFLLDLVDDHKLDFEQCVRYYRESATVISG